VTGHTGFKGAWLTCLLKSRGHRVSGLALDPLGDSLFEKANLQRLLEFDARIDVRDAASVAGAIREASPEIVIHMAAQPLVRSSYADARGTVETNVVGTMNVLEALRHAPSVRAALIVTTDKVYRNTGKLSGYVETDPLGGYDPYSASKAMADLLSSSWANSFAGPSIGVARAGNVIGGGDVSVDRLLPDLIRSFSCGQTAQVRAPRSTRPWQHVLDCLNGYLLLTQKLLESDFRGEAWNFGPLAESTRTVGEVASLAASLWGEGVTWEHVSDDGPHEASLLSLDSEKARTSLGWREYLDFEEAVGWTVYWAKQSSAGLDPFEITMEQVHSYSTRSQS